MADNPNVYENLKEAQFRLLRTIVMYDETPALVIAIASHKEDGVFRVYLEPIDRDGKTPQAHPDPLLQYPAEHPSLGPKLDEWMETDDGKKSGVIRKRMDSKFFNKFRPFPLGMCNSGKRTFYVEWSPLRQQYQGLTPNAIVEEVVSLNANSPSRGGVETLSRSFYECILGKHPTAAECIAALTDPSCENDAHGFHRRFALVRGPIDMLFLAYKADIIGVLPRQDLSLLRLGRSFGYCKEVVAELGVFDTIV